MQKWEYLKLDIHYEDPKAAGVQSVFSNYEDTLSKGTFTDFHNYFNKRGSEGWEIVGERASGERHIAFYFKRPIKKKSNKKSKKIKPS